MVEVQPIPRREEEKSEAKPDRVLGEGGVLTDEDIASLASEGEKVQKEFSEYKHEKTKTIVDIRERIMRHRDKIFTLKVDIGEDEPLILKVRRMNEKERAQFNKDNYTKVNDFNNMDAEQIEAITLRGYKMMAALIVEPKWSVEEWMDVADTALLQFISGKVALLGQETSDAVIIEEFKKKSMTLPNFN